MRLTERELATVLYALRMLQESGIEDPSPHFDECEPLSNEEIDGLCERLNLEA